jgi:hypothetical protein
MVAKIGRESSLPRQGFGAGADGAVVEFRFEDLATGCFLGAAEDAA